ncbi:hypothetical protein [Hydrogenophaga sp. BPS33]|uniref:hypothetical protein n=1 Tax=Hydrogenophaga sp. BPS33 TaxID=2651974 RepID=UPI001320471E|nr:hypothetical protein [Hydrogenophaga sp. BPS33]QHE88619.1 hypothetical protein F9K07_28910 [Hydrogenophaga sp. BPS33]
MVADQRERFGALFFGGFPFVHWGKRIRAATRVAALHFAISLFVAFLVGLVVFRVWYPAPFNELIGGLELFLILVGVDLVCGPLLTFVLFNPQKPRHKWRMDLGTILAVQIGAMVYGMAQLAIARPVYLAFEGDRFRVVQAGDVDVAQSHMAAIDLRNIQVFAGPRLIGVHLSTTEDADLLASLQLSAQGLHPAFRPSRWRPYETQVSSVLMQLRPLRALEEKNIDRADELAKIADVLAKENLTKTQVGFLPLVRDLVTDWVVLVRRADGQPIAYLHLDGW